MEPKLATLRYNYDGVFKKTCYSGGKKLIMDLLEVDEISYTVALENVKDFLNYTEIGGLYVWKEKSRGWKLMTCDVDLLELVDACENGGEIELFVDTVVDKEIELLKPGVPFVIVQPRKNIVEGVL
ncbi:hypothetical protein OROHE_003508 [Orobanche hederae]